MEFIRTTGPSTTLSSIEAVQGTREHGLVGAGMLTVNPGAKALKRVQVTQFLNGGPADPRIGQRPMGVPSRASTGTGRTGGSANGCEPTDPICCTDGCDSVSV